ncbi:MAG: hypothetical protein ABS951_17035 [Solibacillus sp.]
MQNDFVKRYRITGFSLLLLLYTGFTGWQLGRVQAITDFNYTLHEMLYIPAFLCMYVGPIVFIVLCYYMMRAKVVRDMTRRRAASWFVIGVSLVYMAYAVNSQVANSSVAGIYSEVGKYKEDDRYYISLEGRMIEISSEQYDGFDAAADYLLSYTWNDKQLKGNLTSIEKIGE